VRVDTHRPLEVVDPASEKAFEELVGELDYPMLVVTASAHGTRSGCLVGFATQCSIDPPRYAVYLSVKNRTLAVASDATALGVHFLQDTDGDLAELFGGQTGDEIDKFDEVAWHEGSHGVPLIDRCPNRFVGRVVDRHVGGDHAGFVLEPIEVARALELSPLWFQRAKQIEPGHDA